MITSLLQVVNRLAASYMQVVSSTLLVASLQLLSCSESDVHRLDAT